MPGAQKPLISVVLPTYNRPRLLKRAVETVLKQTYPNIELVIMDDHSPVPAKEVLSAYSFDAISNVRQLRHSKNEGANVARNNGIRAASGQFISFLDDDDQWDRKKTAKQVDTFLTADDSVGFVYTGTRYVLHNDAKTAVHTVSGDVTRDILAGAPIAEFSAIMVRADVVERAGLPDERLPSWQDLEWFLRLSLHCRFEPVPEPLTIRRKDHGERIGNRFEERRDVSYPLFVSKHRSLARKHGRRCERMFLAHLLRTLALSALQNSHYAEARKHFVKSIVQYPFKIKPYMYLLSCLGGKYTYRPAQQIGRLLP